MVVAICPSVGLCGVLVAGIKSGLLNLCIEEGKWDRGCGDQVIIGVCSINNACTKHTLLATTFFSFLFIYRDCSFRRGRHPTTSMCSTRCSTLPMPSTSTSRGSTLAASRRCDGWRRRFFFLFITILELYQIYLLVEIQVLVLSHMSKHNIHLSLDTQHRLLRYLQ